MRGTLLREMHCTKQAENILVDLKGKIKSNIVGEIIHILGNDPNTLEVFWESIQPAFEYCRIKCSGEILRRTTSIIADKILQFPDHLLWLTENGYSREDSRQIRYVLEAFYNVEPYFIVISAIARRWLAGLTSEVTVSNVFSNKSSPIVYFGGQIQYGDAGEILSRFGRPDHIFYSALAVWPEYLVHVFEDAQCVMDSEDYAYALDGMDKIVDELASCIPVPRFDGERVDMVDSILRCLAASSEVLLIVCALRRMFIRAEIHKRSRMRRDA